MEEGVLEKWVLDGYTRCPHIHSLDVHIKLSSFAFEASQWSRANGLETQVHTVTWHQTGRMSWDVPLGRRGSLGYCIFLGDNLLSWSSNSQHTLSRSSVEAEYRDVANVVAETTWLRNLLRKLYYPLSTATLVYCDNVSAVYMSVNPVQHQRTKHIEIDIHFVRDMVTAG
nr:NBS-containing resistance-like protein [Tanacetum cinerariifolium]